MSAPTQIIFPPDVIGGRKFPNVKTYAKTDFEDPGKNVLLMAKLFNFDISHRPGQGERQLPDHDRWLALVAAPLLTANPAAGARVIGLASRSGANDYNLRLSKKRARNVAESLAGFMVFDFAIKTGPSPRIKFGGQGELFAANFDVPDGTEDAGFRAVLVTILADRDKSTRVRLLKP